MYEAPLMHQACIRKQWGVVHKYVGAILSVPECMMEELITFRVIGIDIKVISSSGAIPKLVRVTNCWVKSR